MLIARARGPCPVLAGWEKYYESSTLMRWTRPERDNSVTDSLQMKPKASRVKSYASRAAVDGSPSDPSPAKPRTVDEYVLWARDVATADHDARVQKWFEANATAVLNTAQGSAFFVGLPSVLVAAAREYRALHGSDLLMDKSSEVELIKKPFVSLVDKSLRRNVLENQVFPNAPSDGWFIPEVWFRLNNDTVRTVVACKYIDGPQFLVRALQAHAKELNLDYRSKSQQNDDGYYAYHFWVRLPVDLTSFDWQTRREDVWVEIQVTTQLQEVLRSLTHRIYEARRLDSGTDANTWKWEVDGARFRAAYIGHSLHLLEALILKLRPENKDG